MSPAAEGLRVALSTVERDTAWLERWLSDDRTRIGLKRFYGPQSWIDDTEHWKLVADARDTVRANRAYLERVRAELDSLTRAR